MNRKWEIIWGFGLALCVILAFIVSNTPDEKLSDKAERVCKEQHPYSTSDAQDCEYRLLMRYAITQQNTQVSNEQKAFDQ